MLLNHTFTLIKSKLVLSLAPFAMRSFSNFMCLSLYLWYQIKWTGYQNEVGGRSISVLLRSTKVCSSVESKSTWKEKNSVFHYIHDAVQENQKTSGYFQHQWGNTFLNFPPLLLCHYVSVLIPILSYTHNATKPAWKSPQAKMSSVSESLIEVGITRKTLLIQSKHIKLPGELDPTHITTALKSCNTIAVNLIPLLSCSVFLFCTCTRT